jgi:hypothetical protein
MTTMLFAALVLFGVLGAAGGGWWGNANIARNASGGPVKPATRKDSVLITFYFVLAVACIFIGLYFMKR